MLKAAVFDDEYIVLQGLRAMIDWTGLGIELVGTAGDGLSALALFREERPDLIFTDIRMPGMDGLQLIEEVMRDAPETYCIVFSGFNEFDYVKRAINLGVVDYLEKPITIESIEKAIGKVLGRVSEQQEMDAMKRKVEVSSRELLEKAVLELLMSGADAEGKWRESFGPHAAEVEAVTVLAAASEAFAPPDHPAYRAVPVKIGQERLHVLFHFLPPGQELWDQLLGESEQAGTAVGCGRTYPRPAEAAESYRQAARALQSARFLGEKSLVRFEDLGERITAPEGLSEREEAVILSLRSGNREGLMEQAERFIASIQSGKLGIEAAEHEMLRLIYLAAEESKKNAGDAAGGPWESFMPHIEFREMAANGEVAAWFRRQIEKIADWSSSAREDTKHAAVTRARQYIEGHGTRDLTLQEVAEHVGMNPTYFSVLFKEEMGESYIKYLTRYRMELAKSLLLQGLKVQEVSEKVGYHTYRHFSEVFKKYTGVTPGQYKELSGLPAPPA
ncbi:response regulator [Paenibacillus caseinilyticus]|uniref:AraC family transcriptional regulator n=1 Tax=Paenibacillus mucilaginosus K02 TaxID=997761 RepID=I0BGV6_9BACL|nr:response regulator [Paenibacillus mucilaginosus]AFH61603.1 AraC family transcriptional regulator [Paenibacillus mucilaginosus K02]